MMINYTRRGVLLVLCAPSGAGKTTLVSRLRKRYPELCFSLSCTTRPKRQGEEDGVHYHFIERTKFETQCGQHFFAEWADVHGHLYGTPAAPLEEALQRGTDVLFDIDVQGAKQLKDSLRYGSFVFIFPPSFDVLRERLQNRATDTEIAIEARLNNAKQEVMQAPWFDYWIINDDLETAFQQLCAVYEAAKLNPACHPTLLEKL